MRSLRLLVVEDSEDDALLVVRDLRRAGWTVEFERVETATALSAALDAASWDVVVADYSLPGFSGPEALALIKARGLDLPFIIVSGTIGEAAAVAAMKAGAHDYVMKGHLARLAPVVDRELEEAADRRRRAQAERALFEEREWSRLLVEHASVLIVGLDADGAITLFNPAAEAATGYAKEQVRGRNWYEVVVPRQRYPDAWKAFRHAREPGPAIDMEEPLLTAAGEERLVAWHRSVLAGDRWRPGVIGFGLDVTERKRAERDRMALEHATRQMERLAALGSLAAGLAHELNTPIGIISSRIELMLLENAGGALPPDVAEDLKVIHRHAQRMGRLAAGLLSLGRRSSGERRPVDLNRAIEDALLLVGPQTVKGGIEIVSDLAPDVMVVGDSNAFQQVLLNLLANARDAMAGRAGRLSIATRREPAGMVRLEIADTGAGIAPEDVAHIFEPFFTTKPTGTGLGLAITYGIVREHGGTIEVDSAPGRGTRFVLTLPAA
jgi:PAS domain S-box-containing protein